MEVPADTPVTTPVVEPIVATPVLLLLQVPPPVPSLNVVVAPWQILVTPVIGRGDGYTVTVMAAAQPVLRVYEMVEVPAATPVTIPVDEPIVATVVLLLVQIPPPVASLNVVVDPAQIPVV